MRIAITGTSSGVGKCLSEILAEKGHTVIEITRDEYDLDYPWHINRLGFVDILINCAGHDLGGKVPFHEHTFVYWRNIMNTNLLSPMRLCQLAIRANPIVTIVNITSTNNDKFWPGDLAYSLSKKSLEEFGNMLFEEHPDITVKEVRLGLTKTNFNANRHKVNHKPIDDLYSNKHLLPEDVAAKICEFIFSNETFIRIAP